MGTEDAAGKPLAEQVYENVSRLIVSGELAAGEPLVQEKIAAQFDVSRTPVRDALTQLTTDGLATLVSSRGYFVTDLSRNQVEDVFEVRAALEELALRSAFGRHAPKDLLHLRTLAAEARLCSPTDGMEVFDVSLRFHRRLVEPCPNGYMLELLGSVWSHPVQRRIALTYTPGREHVERVASDHERIIDALEAHDLAKATEILRICHDPADERGGPIVE